MIRRGAQSGIALNAAIVGGGKACDDLLVLLNDERSKRLKMRVIGVADPNMNAPGITRARRMSIFTTPDFEELFSLPGLNLLIELTGSMKVRERMIQTKPLEVSSIDHRGARLLWDFIQLEAEKEQSEKESEQRLRKFTDSAHDIVCIKDLDGHYLYLNPATSKLMDIPVETALGKTDFDIFPLKVARNMAEHDRQVLECKNTLFYKESMRVGGQVHRFDTVRFPVFSDEGQITALAIIARDMTEEIALQEEVRRNKEYLENVLTYSSDMIITTDLDRQIVTCNPTGERMLGYKEKELKGSQIEDLWKHPDQRQHLMSLIKEKRAVTNAPGVLIAKDGHEVEISISLSLLRDTQGEVIGTVGISRDVTEENKLRRQLIEQERLAAVGQTVAGITHYMKNLLNGLKGGAYMVNVAVKREDPKLLKEGWDNVQKGIERISKLCLDMLSYCRDRRPELVSVDPLRLIQETAQFVSKSAEQEGISVLCDGQEGVTVRLDKDMMARAILNLIANAIDACKEKSYTKSETPRIDLSFTQKEGKAFFIVSDNGIGMDESIRRHLFERFFSTKDASGTGLGLCVTHKIINEHKGSIQVESRPGKGSRFIIEVPLNLQEDHAGVTS